MTFGVYYKNKLQLQTSSPSEAVSEAKILSILVKGNVIIKSSGEVLKEYSNGKAIK